MSIKPPRLPLYDAEGKAVLSGPSDWVFWLVFIGSIVGSYLLISNLVGEQIPTWIIGGGSLIIAFVASYFASKLAHKLENMVAPKQNAAKSVALAKFEEREIEARRARAAKTGKTYK